MEKIVKLLNDIFESDLTIFDMDREVQEVLQWDSFHIMNFLIEAEEQFHKKITIGEISKVYCVQDLLQLLEKE